MTTAIEISQEQQSVSPEETRGKRPYFTCTFRDALWPGVYLLSLSLLGLHFYPAFLVMLMVMFRAYRHDRYELIIELVLLFGGYAMLSTKVTRIDLNYLVTPIAICCFFIIRNIPIVRKAIVLTLCYALALAVFAYLSDESWRNQLGYYLRYISFAFFIYPILLFSGREFDMDKFLHKTMIFVMILCFMYLIDGLILCGDVLIPRSTTGTDYTFYDTFMRPFSFASTRKYPQSLYLMSIALYAVLFRWRLKPWMWVVVLATMFITRTFTFISGLIVAFVIFQSSFKRIMLFILAAVVAVVTLYFVDGMLKTDVEQGESQLRIKSSIDQLLDIYEIQDDADLAELGSGRMAQAMPKMELMYNLGREWIGLGFLDRDKTTLNKYIVDNEYYVDEEEALEVATGVEIIVLQVILNIGYIGLILHVLFYLVIYLLVRKLPHAKLLLMVMFCFVWWGIGGFSGLITTHGLYITAITFAAVVLANKRELPGFALPERKTRLPR